MAIINERIRVMKIKSFSMKILILKALKRMRMAIFSLMISKAAFRKHLTYMMSMRQMRYLNPKLNLTILPKHYTLS